MDKLSHRIKGVVEALHSLGEHADTLDDVQERIENSRGALEQLQEQHNALKKEHEEFTAAHTKQLVAMKTEIDALRNEKETELHRYNNAISAARATLKNLEVAIESMRGAHDQVVASIESLRKRLA